MRLNVFLLLLLERLIPFPVLSRTFFKLIVYETVFVFLDPMAPEWDALSGRTLPDVFAL